jgi:hypothetical protein
MAPSVVECFGHQPHIIQAVLKLANDGSGSFYVTPVNRKSAARVEQIRVFESLCNMALPHVSEVRDCPLIRAMADQPLASASHHLLHSNVSQRRASAIDAAYDRGRACTY